MKQFLERRREYRKTLKKRYREKQQNDRQKGIKRTIVVVQTKQAEKVIAMMMNLLK